MDSGLLSFQDAKRKLGSLTVRRHAAPDMVVGTCRANQATRRPSPHLTPCPSPLRPLKNKLKGAPKALPKGVESPKGQVQMDNKQVHGSVSPDDEACRAALRINHPQLTNTPRHTPCRLSSWASRARARARLCNNFATTVPNFWKIPSSARLILA